MSESIEDLAARLVRLEHDRDERAKSWLRRAAKERAWRDPDMAHQLVDPGQVESPEDARRRIANLDAGRAYLRGPAGETEEEQRRRHGEELLRGLEDGGRGAA